MERIIGKQIILREYRISDAEEIYKWRNDGVTTGWLGRKYREPASFEEVRESLVKVIDSDQSDSVFFAIADRDTEAYIGGIDLTSIDWTDKIGILSIVIGEKDRRNRGVATEAVAMLLDYAFRKMRLHKVELNVHDDNTAAIKCYQRNGFKIEGESREHFFREGKYYNVLSMGILESEYTVKTEQK